jgi:glycosyltransferase involved in cell wall biosynthesis
MTPRLSVVVCTYNRADLLPGCLESLADQMADKHVYEVIVVNNNSTDTTQEIAESFTRREPNFRVVVETAQGLSQARNRGFKEARGQLVAYIDDDAKAHPDWVRSTTHFFEIHPDASGVGGPYKAYSLVPIPEWFPEEYGSKSMGNETRLLQKGESISGTNMAFKRSALIEVDGFDTALGMTGEKVSYGEEAHLTRKMLERGMKIFYCAEMCVDHAILPYKLKLRWLLRSNFANGYDCVTAFNYAGNARSFLPSLFRSAKYALHLLLYSKERHLKARLYRSSGQLMWHLGFFVKLIGR